MSAGHISPLRRIGRCELFSEIGSGGMATVHLGRIVAAGGFSNLVAVKRMHEQLAKDPQFVAMFVDEARLVSRIRHPNVRPTLDLIDEDGELFIVMEYVAGLSLRRVFFEMDAKGERVPPEIAAAVICGVLHGLHAAHNATDAEGQTLELVHRDVSPENILVGVDGMARLLDFGMAKALGRLHLTQPGLVKGKLTVMAPEQVQGKPVTPRTDVFATGVVLWQALTGRRLIDGEHIAEVAHNVIHQRFEPPSSIVDWLPPRLDAIVMRAIARDPAERWESAEAMAVALEGAVSLASRREVATWVQTIGAAELEAHNRLVAEIERTPVGLTPHARVSRPDGSPEPSAEGRYTWLTTTFGNARRAIDDARARIAASVTRDAAGRLGVKATARKLWRTTPRWVTVGAGVGIFAVVGVLIAASGEDDVRSDEDDADGVARGEERPRRTSPAQASSPAASATASAAASVPTEPWVLVPAGEHLLGCNTWADRLCAPDEMPPTRVHVDAFLIERTEVTVGAYQACVDAGACDAEGLDSHGIADVKLEPLDKCNYGREGRESHPINCVRHEQAARYCEHVGGRLPTEAEWEKAAAGADAWPFPNGEASMTCETAILNENGDGCGRGTTWPVGSKPSGATPVGLLDMAGNVREWVADFYEPSHRGVATTNPRGPQEGALRVTKGGSWRDAAARQLRTSARTKQAPATHAIEVGFRCVKPAR